MLFKGKRTKVAQIVVVIVTCVYHWAPPRMLWILAKAIRMGKYSKA
jgi:hypothetical protein